MTRLPGSQPGLVLAGVKAAPALRVACGQP
jgi:hypothetical protein